MYEIVSVEEFEETDLPKKLFLVTLKKKAVSRGAKDHTWSHHYEGQ